MPGVLCAAGARRASPYRAELSATMEELQTPPGALVVADREVPPWP